MVGFSLLQSGESLMAEATSVTKTSQLKSHTNELTKVHNAYDASNRIEYTYTATDDALDGGPCLCTRFSYDGVSSRIVYAKEYNATWTASWEIF